MWGAEVEHGLDIPVEIMATHQRLSGHRKALKLVQSINPYFSDLYVI